MQEKLEIKVFFFFYVNTHCTATATPATVGIRKKLSKQPWDEKNVLFTMHINVTKVISKKILEKSYNW